MNISTAGETYRYNNLTRTFCISTLANGWMLNLNFHTFNYAIKSRRSLQISSLMEVEIALQNKNSRAKYYSKGKASALRCIIPKLS